MRKVLYKKWIPLERHENGARKQDTGIWEKGFPHQGLFHQWGNSYEEFDSGAGNYTIALVETSEGTIEEVLPSNIKFIS